MDFGSFSFGLACALVLALSITLHELGHALTARAFGYQTRDITLSLLGGCASLTSMPRKASQEFLTALAGPLVSFALAGVGWAAVRFLPIENDWLLGVLVYVFWMNLILGGFNLLPGFPMDGGRIFRSVARIFTTRAKATYAAMHAWSLGLYLHSHRVDDLARGLAGVRDGRSGGALGKPVGVFGARLAAPVFGRRRRRSGSEEEAR